MTSKSIITLLAVVGVALLGGYYFMQTNESADVATNETANMPVEETNANESDKGNTPSGAYAYDLSSGNVKYVANKVFLNKDPELVTGTNSKLVGEGFYNPETNNGHVLVTFNFSDFSTGSAARDSDVFQNYIQDKNIKVEGDFMDLDVTEGTAQTANLPLNVTINGVTKPVNFDVTFTVTPESMTAKGSSKVMMSEFNVTPPSALSIYNVQDEITLEFDVMGAAMIN